MTIRAKAEGKNIGKALLMERSSQNKPSFGVRRRKWTCAGTLKAFTPACFLFVSILCGAPLSAEDAPKLLEEAVNRMSDYFKTVKSLEFQVRQETFAPDGGFTETFNFVGMGPWYRYDVSNGTPEFNDTVAFNGDYGQCYSKVDGLLKVKKRERLDDADAMFVLGALDPFSWFTENQCEGFRSAHPNHSVPTLSLLSDADAWKRRLTEGTSIQTALVDGKPMLRVKMPGGVETSRTVKSTYSVSFDPGRGFFPVAFERETIDGNERETYAVDEFGSVTTPDGKSVIYPKKATRYIYYSEATPYCKKTIVVTGFRIGKTYDRDTFTIDPASAKIIHGLDTKTYIQVPK